MTYHIKEKVVDDEPEELPEDGIAEGQSEINDCGAKETIAEEKAEDNEEDTNNSNEPDEL